MTRLADLIDVNHLRLARLALLPRGGVCAVIVSRTRELHYVTLGDRLGRIENLVNVGAEVVHGLAEFLQPMIDVGVIASIALFVGFSVGNNDIGLPSPSLANVRTEGNSGLVALLKIGLALQIVLTDLKLNVSRRIVVVGATLALAYAPGAIGFGMDVGNSHLTVCLLSDEVMNGLVNASVPMVSVRVLADDLNERGILLIALGRLNVSLQAGVVGTRGVNHDAHRLGLLGGLEAFTLGM